MTYSKKLIGTLASEGLAYGKIHIIAEPPRVARKDVTDVEAEVVKFKQSCVTATEQIKSLMATSNLAPEQIQIFEAHLMMVEDEELQTGVIEKIRSESVSADYAISTVAHFFADTLSALDDEYMRERASDVMDISERLIYACLDLPMFSVSSLTEPVILVAKDLTPSQTMQLTKDKVLGFITEIGGPTSHTAIIARTLEVPAIVGVKNLLNELKSGDLAILNALNNEILVTPDNSLIENFKNQEKSYNDERAQLHIWKNRDAKTTDGKQFMMSANINAPSNLDIANENNAEGIGLFRSEMIFLSSNTLPSEEKQFMAYKHAAEKMKGRDVVIRTLDVGGDKEVPGLSLPKEANPFLGYRAIRLCLKETEIFQSQLRAILRASHYGKVAIMFPMICLTEELIMAKEQVEITKEQLRQKGIPFDEKIEIGAMIETPSSVILADKLVKYVDFFSIGANDLVQYTLVVDRTNEYVDNLNQPLAPSVLRMIKMAIDATHAGGKWISMCGEMAGMPNESLILAGLGLDEFSMNPNLIPRVRSNISKYSLSDLQELANKAVECERVDEVKSLLKEFTSK